MQNHDRYTGVDWSESLPIVSAYPYERASTLHSVLNLIFLTLTIAGIIAGGILSTLPGAFTFAAP